MALRIRQHDRNPNLWWVSSPEDDVAYIARPGNHYRAWTTYGWKPGHANFVGIPFETIEEALRAGAKGATLEGEAGWRAGYGPQSKAASVGKSVSIQMEL